jgi:predicted short-subunit dehydrogenase-like oxidoreductase (DUF2520 family)
LTTASTSQAASVRPSLGIIGAGRLGSCLALALERAGYPIAAISSATPQDAAALCAHLTRAVTLDAAELTRHCELVILTVPDGAIAPLAATLPWRAGQAAIHCSGALPLDALDGAADAGALRGCLHPLQTFPEPGGSPDRFVGITCGIEADAPLDARLEAICHALGASSLRLHGVDRASYHAAAVFASNYVVALHAAAARAFAHAGLPADRARSALGPLTLGAATQIAGLPLAQALTGPIARGDVSTVNAHLQSLQRDPALHDLYRSLARTLLELPIALSPQQLAQLQTLLAAARRDPETP